MPEINDAEYRQFVRYQNIGTPDEIAKKAADLVSDNGKQRDEIRDLKEKVPKDGEVVVPKAKADALTQYEELGTPEDLKKLKTDVGELRTKDETRTREDAFRALVKAAGLPDDTVATLLDMRSLDGAAVEVKTEKNDKGEDVEVPYVTLAGDGQKPQKFSEFAAEAPQLKGLKTTPETTTSTGGSQFVRQSPTGAAPQTARTEEDFQKATAETANYTL